MPTSSASNSRRLWILAALIAIAALIGGLMWQRWRAPRRSVYIVGVPERGAALFFGKKQCATCHSINGSGGRVAPDLSGTRPGTPAMGWLTAVLWNHAPGMFRQMRQRNLAYPHLNSEEMAHVLAFLYQSANADRAGDPNSGERVFLDKGCSHCHSIRNSGGRTAPDLAALGAGGTGAWTSAMWNHAHSMVGPVTRDLGRWPQFSGDEMNDLIAYARSGEPARPARTDLTSESAERGWQVFQLKCIECHAVRAQGGAIGPALGPEHELPLGEAQFASVLWNHAPAMLQRGISLPRLEGDEVADLRTFLASLRYFEPVGSALVGERVFTERGCARCHGAEAQGTKLGPPLRSSPEAFSTVSFATALWRHGPHMVDRAEESGVKWPVLEASDIGDLVSFLNRPAQK
ncbi:MAG TPA: c-type cytochrome [Bryobacteraceae bacterium]|nr:c-type cytochrome [Bryobacteraceae bacterium]